MNPKGLLALPAIGALAAAFIIVSLVVHISRGRPPLIRAKLKLGALILTLMATLSTGCDTRTGVTCYLPAPQDRFDLEITAHDEWGVLLDLAQGGELRGDLSFRQHERYAFLLLDEAGVEKQRGEILPLDGDYDTSSEVFVLTIDTSLDPGRHELEFHLGAPDEISGGGPLERYRLTLIRSEA